jgi:predicted helicase
LFIKKKEKIESPQVQIYYASLDQWWRKEQKYAFLEQKEHIGIVNWQKINTTPSHNWLMLQYENDFQSLVSLGNKETKISKNDSINTVFKLYSLGVSTNRDDVVYDYNKDLLSKRIKQFCKDFDLEVLRYQQSGKPDDIDNFINYKNIKWSRDLKRDLKNGVKIEFDEYKIRESIYRPYTKTYLYYADVLNDSPALFKFIFPDNTAEKENLVLCVNQTAERPFACILANKIPNLVMCGGFGSATQCFPFYTYAEDGTNKQNNITDWSLQQFQEHYQDKSISKLDIFHYVYGILYHPGYRNKYGANLKRELPRIPFAPAFWDFANAGARLAELHVNYEKVPEYPLKLMENKEEALDWRVERRKLSPDKTQIIYNDFLTLAGIPPEVFEYRLGNRSALDWIIDQYQVSTDKRSGITNDPNRADDPQYIVRLIGQVITVSLETMKIVKSLPAFE